MDEGNTKIMYEINKLTNKSRQITDDFIDTITIVMFREFLSVIPNKEKYVDTILDNWEYKIISQKKKELDLLVTEHTTLFELTAGVIVANSEDLNSFIKEVREIKNLYRESLLLTM
jgi:hypothetical protein